MTDWIEGEDGQNRKEEGIAGQRDGTGRFANERIDTLAIKYHSHQSTTEQNRTEQNRTEQNRTE
jgi:hypothetical protein